jgi:excisionase family DNA binding protein
MPKLSVSDTSVTYDEAADILGVSRRTVHRLREDGVLVPIVGHTLRGGARVRFDRKAVEALLTPDAPTSRPTSKSA